MAFTYVIKRFIIQNRLIIYFVLLLCTILFGINLILVAIDWWDMRFLRSDQSLRNEFVQNYQTHFKKAAENSLTKLVSANMIISNIDKDFDSVLLNDTYNDPLLNPTLIVPKLTPDNIKWSVSKFDDHLIVGKLEAYWKTNDFENGKSNHPYKILITEYYHRESGSWKFTKGHMDVNPVFRDEDF